MPPPVNTCPIAGLPPLVVSNVPEIDPVTVVAAVVILPELVVPTALTALAVNVDVPTLDPV
jgi:hypothetical protein